MDNNISESLLQAMSTLIGDSTQSVIEATIVKCTDAVMGEYRVNYQANEFTVYSTNATTMVYADGEQVYVIIPNGDFTKVKYILGTAQPGETPASKNTEGTSSNVSTFVEISDNLFGSDFNGVLHSYSDNPEVKDLFEDVTGDKADLLTTGLKKLASYINDGQKLFHLNFSAKTALDTIQRTTGGAYGIKITIPLQKEFPNGAIELIRKTFECVSRNNTTDDSKQIMPGKPMEYYSWADNTLKIDLEESGYTVPSGMNITVEISKGVYPSGEGENDNFIIDIDKSDIEDIWFSNISLYAVKDLSENELTGYYLNINASESRYFILSGSRPTSNDKTLTPELKANGIKVETSNANFYWFEEDLTVDNASEWYTDIGGGGWKCLNEHRAVYEEVEGQPPRFLYYDYTPQDSYQVNINDIVSSKEYKCVAIYNGSRISNTITITKVSSDVDYIFETSDGASAYETGRTIELVTKLYCNGITTVDDYRNDVECQYAAYDISGNCINSFVVTQTSINEPVVIGGKRYYVTKGTINSSIIENILTIKCLTRQKSNNRNLGSKYISLAIKEPEKDFKLYTLLINEINNPPYTYDAKGYSPMLDVYEGNGGNRIKFIDPLSFTIYDKDGNIFENEDYASCNVEWKVSKNSLIIPKNATSSTDDKYWIVSGIGHVNMPYDIADYYDIIKKENFVELTVTYNNYTMHETKSLFFTKTGELGTNGTGCLGNLAVNISRHQGEYYTYKQPVVIQVGETDKVVEQYLELLAVAPAGSTVYSWFYKDTDGIYKTVTGVTFTFAPIVYKDGRLVEDTSSYSVRYSMFDNGQQHSVTINENTGVITLVPNKTTNGIANDLKDNIVQATVTMDNLKLFTYYPIEIKYIEANVTGQMNAGIAADVLPEIDGYYSVMYRSSGYDPRIDRNTTIFTVNTNQAVLIPDTGETGDPKWNWEYHPINCFTHNASIEDGYELSPKNVRESLESYYYISINKNITISSLGITQVPFYHYKPLLIYNNRYGLETLNGWDGTKLEINEEGNYIYGAYSGWGVKDDDNGFTGVLMGSVNSEDSIQNGLFAYKDGVQTFGLKSADGSLEIGKAGKGQIRILPGSDDPDDSDSATSARIVGGNYIDKDDDPKLEGSGMEIDLSDPHIYWGNQKFKVDKDGNLTATNAFVKGRVEANTGKLGNLDVTGTLSIADSGDGKIIMTDDLATYYVSIERGEIYLYSLCESYDNGAEWNDDYGFYWNKKTHLSREGLHVDNNPFNETLDMTVAQDDDEPGYVGMAGVFRPEWDLEDEYGEVGRGYHRGFVDINADGLKLSHFDYNTTIEDWDESRRIYDFRVGHLKDDNHEIKDIIGEIEEYWDDSASPKCPEETLLLMQDPDNDTGKFLLMAHDQLVMLGDNRELSIDTNTTKISPNLFRVRNMLDPSLNTIMKSDRIGVNQYFGKKSGYKVNGKPLYKLTNKPNSVVEGKTNLEDGCFIFVYDGPDRIMPTITLYIYGARGDIITIRDEDNNLVDVIEFDDTQSYVEYNNGDIELYNTYVFRSKLTTKVVTANIITTKQKVDCRMDPSHGWEFALLRYGTFNLNYTLNIEVVFNDAFDCEYVGASGNQFESYLYYYQGGNYLLANEKIKRAYPYPNNIYNKGAEITTWYTGIRTDQVISTGSRNPDDYSTISTYDEINVCTGSTSSSASCFSLKRHWGVSGGDYGSTLYFSFNYKVENNEVIKSFSNRFLFDGIVNIFVLDGDDEYHWETFDTKDYIDFKTTKDFVAFTKAPETKFETFYYDARGSGGTYSITEQSMWDDENHTRISYNGRYSGKESYTSYTTSERGFTEWVARCDGYYMIVDRFNDWSSTYGDEAKKLLKISMLQSVADLIVLYEDNNGQHVLNLGARSKNSVIKLTDAEIPYTTRVGVIAIKSYDYEIPKEIALLGYTYNNNTHGFFYNTETKTVGTASSGTYFVCNGTGVDTKNKFTGDIYSVGEYPICTELMEGTASWGWGHYALFAYPKEVSNININIKSCEDDVITLMDSNNKVLKVLECE